MGKVDVEQEETVRRRVRIPLSIDKQIQSLAEREGVSEFIVFKHVIKLGLDAYSKQKQESLTFNNQTNETVSKEYLEKQEEMLVAIYGMLCYYMKPFSYTSSHLLTGVLEEESLPMLEWTMGADYNIIYNIWVEIGKHLMQGEGFYSSIYSSLKDEGINTFDFSGANKKVWEKKIKKEKNTGEK